MLKGILWVTKKENKALRPFFIWPAINSAETTLPFHAESWLLIQWQCQHLINGSSVFIYTTYLTDRHSFNAGFRSESGITFGCRYWSRSESESRHGSWYGSCEGRLKACSKRDEFFSFLLFNRHKQQRSRTLHMNRHLRQSGPPSAVSVETASTNERASA